MKVGDCEGLDVCLDVEMSRLCGFRKPSKNGVGVYLMGGFVFEQCERLPFPLRVCPVCGVGLKFSRGFTWIIPASLFCDEEPPGCQVYDPETGGQFSQVDGQERLNVCGDEHDHAACYLCNPASERHGLLWVGRQHYTPHEFMAEAMLQGISRKIGSLPNDFVLGQTIIYLAHVDAVAENDPGVFTVFKPTGIDLVIDDAENIPDTAKRVARRAIKRNDGGQVRFVQVNHE